MAPEMTAHDRRLHDEGQRQYWLGQVRALRDDLMRQAPAGRYLDGDHLAEVLAAGAVAQPGNMAWRRLIARMVGRGGELEQLVMRGLHATSAELAAWRLEELWWDPPTEQLRRIPEQWRAGLVGARPSL